jgi:FK506-binding protein 2
MKSTAWFAALASAAIGFAAADELKIEKTQTVQCERKTVKGDMVSMHYHGTLADTGNKFDASTWPSLGSTVVGGS